MEPAGLQNLLDRLSADGYRVIGPTLREQAIVYDEVSRIEDLPRGWTDEQAPGYYRLKPRLDGAYFGYAVGPQSWKKELFPPRLLLLDARRKGKDVVFEQPAEDSARLAFLGVRSCELHAIAIQDRVLLNADPVYRRRREQLLLIAVQCGQAGGTCFCVSMKTGPLATSGFDLALTEILSPGPHRFLVEVGSPRGADVASAMPCRPATDEDFATARSTVEKTAGQMGRTMDTQGIKELLYRNQENPRWDDVASRCLSCANCTMACPTCFCSTVEDTTDLTGDHAQRWRQWDSCFNAEFSHIHGGTVRPSTRARYRQWMTHKLASWIDQFGTSGCVGCGRCVTWCPVGIDLTAEVSALRESEKKRDDD